MVIPALTARIIYADLQRLPLVLKENQRLRGATQAYATNDVRLRAELVAKDTVLVATGRQLAVAKMLGRDAENRAAQWRSKAKKRGWTNAALAALAVLITLVAVR